MSDLLRPASVAGRLYELFPAVQKADEAAERMASLHTMGTMATWMYVIPRYLWEDVREALERCR